MSCLKEQGTGRAARGTRPFSRRREIYAPDEEWMQIKAAAKLCGKSISRYLIERNPTGLSNAMIDLAGLTALASMQKALDRIAAEVIRNAKGETLPTLSVLVAIEAKLSEIAEGRGQA